VENGSVWEKCWDGWRRVCRGSVELIPLKTGIAQERIDVVATPECVKHSAKLCA
jgi:hypothetical protein